MSKWKGIFFLCVILAAGSWGRQILWASPGKTAIVDGSPAYGSACCDPSDPAAGGYNNAVVYNDTCCEGASSTWKFKNGYVFWSTTSRVASSKASTIYRSVGWDITFSYDLNENGKIADNEKITISVARTIQGSSYAKMNYYYLDYQQCITDGVKYNYSLYAMSYDRLQELARNHERAESKDGRTPVTDALFSNPVVYMDIDAIMVTVKRDASKNETLNGYIAEENGTTKNGISSTATGTLSYGGTVYHCKNASDYKWLSTNFNASSIATYKNRGSIRNYKVNLEYYVDTSQCQLSAKSPWSIDKHTGQLFYDGKPYVESRFFWQLCRIRNLRDVVSGDTYHLTGKFRCGDSACYVRDNMDYHTSYLAQYAVFPSKNGNIYSENGTLKLYAAGEAAWEKNGYVVQYYTKTAEDATGYSLIGIQNCATDEEYQFYQLEQTSAPVLEGVQLLGWTKEPEAHAGILECGSSFTRNRFPDMQEESGGVVKLYARWGVTTYTIQCNGNQPTGEQSCYAFYEIYGIGYTTNKAFAEKISDFDPFYWKKSTDLLSGEMLRADQPEKEGYFWNGYWNQKKAKQYFQPNGMSLFSSNKEFAENQILYGDWKKIHTLSIRYQLGDHAVLKKQCDGYGMDSNGYLTYNGQVFEQQVREDNTLTVIPVLEAISREGYTKSSGWRIRGGEELVIGGAEYRAKQLAGLAGIDLGEQNGSIILELEWTPVTYFVDYYLLNEQTNNYELKAVQECEYDRADTLYSEKRMQGLVIPVGKEFEGWSKSCVIPEITYMVGEPFVNLCKKDGERMSLYGEWTGKRYAIALNENCPCNSFYPVNKGTGRLDCIYGVGFLLPEEPKQSATREYRVIPPTCKGYVFLGYYDQPENGNQMIDEKGNVLRELSLQYAGDRSLYAHWEKKQYTITYYANGGEYENGEEKWYMKAKCANGDYLPAAMVPVRKGYSFDGYKLVRGQDSEMWYNRYLNANGRRFYETQDISLYAVWVDDIMPTGTMETSVGGQEGRWTNQNVRLSISAHDTGSGVTKVQLYQRRYFEETYHLLEEWTTEAVRDFYKEIWIEENGISSFYCVVYDACGNTNVRISGAVSDSGEQISATVYIDKIAPKVTLPIIDFDETEPKKASVSLYASDDIREER